MATKAREKQVTVVFVAAAAIEHEKALFLARNADKCTHLLVRLEPSEDSGTLIIRAAFTLDEVRDWHEAEARVPLVDLTLEAGPDRALIAAFGQLDEGISAARIARLFAPLSGARRLAAGRA